MPHPASRRSGTIPRPMGPPGTLNEPRLRQLLAQEPLWRVTTVDGLGWIDPYSGTVVATPFGHEPAALNWLKEHRPWIGKDGRPASTKPLAELLFIRWSVWLKAMLPDPEAGWLRFFLPDGRWLNTFNGQPVGGIVRDNGRMTIDTLRQLAAVLRDCPEAQAGTPLSRERLAAIARELAPPAPPRYAPPPQPAPQLVRPTSFKPPAPQPTDSDSESKELAPATMKRPGTDALDPSTARVNQARPSGRYKRSETRPHVKADSRSGVRKSGQPPTEPSIRVVSGYRIIGTLGMGGMSTVYRAVQMSMEREVALKVLDHQGPPDPAYTERFLREARSAGRINHPNVVTCYDVGVHHGSKLYMALELVTGGDATALADRHGGRLPERLALSILRDAARGLGAIHGAGLVHRDIKPANIFLAADGAAKLGDLGLVRDLSASGPDGRYRTMVGIAVGTPAFMSPEQSQGAKDVDIRADVYSLGASIFALLAGRPPYEADSMFDLVQRILTDPVPDVRSHRHEVSPSTAALLVKAMAKDRASRYQTPGELQIAAEEALTVLNEAARGALPASEPHRAADLQDGIDRLRAHGFRIAEVRGKGLITTVALPGSVLCVAASGGVLPQNMAAERLDARLRAYTAAQRPGSPANGPEPTVSSLVRALLVDGLSAVVAQVDLGQRSVAIASTPGARAVLVNHRDSHLLTELPSTGAPIPIPAGALAVLAAGMTGRPLTLWGMVVARCDQGADAVVAHIPLIADGAAIMVLGVDG